MKFLLAFVLMLAIPSWADAACSPTTGVTSTCAAGTTLAQITTALSTLSDGAVLTFDAGAYTWSGNIDTQDMSKGFTLICVSVGACDVTLSGNPTFWYIDYTGIVDKLFRLSGFTFGGTACGGNGCIDMRRISAGGNGDDNQLSQVRIDHNAINIPMTVPFLFMGAGDRRGEVDALFDHNTITSVNAGIVVHMVAGHSITAQGSPEAWGTSSRGTSHAVYIEDNVFTFDDETAALSACSDMHQGGKTVFRFNTVLNCRPQTHGMAHGGVELWEVYGNDIRTTVATGNVVTCYGCIQTQGVGELYVFDNQIRGLTSVDNSVAITTQNYRSGSGQPGPLGLCDGTVTGDGNTAPEATYRGYPCVGQPGRMEADGTPLYGKLAPNAAWGNYNGHTSATIDLNIRGNGTPDYWDEHLVANRDYYNVTASFDGTSGIGVGTLASRPATCTHTTSPDGDDGGGVMYWATDQGSWNTSSSNPYGEQRNGVDGVLYRCSATNTWVTHYTPYTYPHPLQGGVADPGTRRFAPSINLRRADNSHTVLVSQ